MKTQYSTQKKSAIFKAITFILVLILQSNFSNAQISKKCFGLILNTTTTGNGHGLIFSPGIIFNSNKSQLALEFNFQKRNGNFSGTQLTYEYAIYNGSNPRNLYCDKDIFDVFLYLNARYNSNLVLGDNQIRIEKKADPESSTDFSNLKFSTAEMYLGFGVRTKIAKHIKWVNSIGIGGYETLSGAKDIYREGSTICLTLKTGLSINL